MVSIHSWEYLTMWNILATDGEEEIKFWSLSSDNAKLIYTIKHELAGTCLYFHEKRNTLFHVGDKKIVAYHL